MPKTNYDVAIIGCGPVGATLANYLKHYGHSVAVFERYKDVYFCPRAGGIDDESLRNFDTIGIYDRLNKNGDFFEGDLAFCDKDERPLGAFNRRRLGDELMFEYAGYYKQNMFHQPNMETALREAYQDSDLVDSYMGYDMLEIEDLSDTAKLKAKCLNTGEHIEIDAKYIVGCDGANSMVREALGVEITDFNYSEDYLIVDANVADKQYLKSRFPDGAKFILDPIYAGIVGQSPHGHVRLDFRRHTDSVIGGEFATEEDYIQAGNELIAARNFDLDKLEIVRRAHYTFEAKTPVKWRVGRFMVAGDAAHLTPPWSGQGMNMGIRDAANIALKINLVLSGKAGASILDTYTQERRPPSLKTIKAAVQTGKFMETTNPILVGLRNFGLRLSGMFAPIARAQFKNWQNKPPYKEGLIGGRHKVSGTWMIQPNFADRFGNVQRMDKFIGLNFALLSTGMPNGKNVHRFMTELDGVVLKVGVDFQDIDGRFMAWCKENDAHSVLVRPDRYIFDAGTDGDALCASLFNELGNFGEDGLIEERSGRKSMRGMKIYNGINGALYSVYGLLGAFAPKIVFDANAIEQVGVHGSHSIRALWGAICTMGLLILWHGLKSHSARATTLIVALVSTGLVAARLLGVAMDGTEGMVSDQFGPLVIEGVMAVGGLLIWRNRTN
ncbi:MAG: 3-(3-hydroxy-phenyl)propionate/3-hydroxycinnamic acid hydroxylase [Verrucomicrobia subdivision 3 bacterium]|nr:3-(3-hydroxy-phenyl)propionate/3-hydroxycinnamic acid hydroxylase [Limisphaerales bacterium]